MGATVFDWHPHDENLTAYWQPYGLADGSSVACAGEDIAFFTGVPLALFNAAIVTEGRPDSIDRLHRHLSDRINVHDVPARWWISPSARNRVVTKQLEDLGIQPVGLHPAMEMNIMGFAPRTRVNGLTFRHVTGQAERGQWAYMLCHFFGFSEEVSLAVSAVEAAIPENRLSDQCRFLAYLGDQAVAAACVVFSSGIAGIYAVATDPDLRGRGIGSAITEHAMSVGRRMGANTCVLQATEMGKPVYERIGFRTVFEYSLFEQVT